MTEIKVYLTLIGTDFDTEYVTAQLGIQPDEVREKNELLGNGRKFGHTEWGICSELQVADELEPILRETVSRFKCDTPLLYNLCSICNAEWHLLILLKIYDEDTPFLYFPADIVHFLGDIRAQIGFDNYMLSSNPE